MTAGIGELHTAQPVIEEPGSTNRYVVQRFSSFLQVVPDRSQTSMEPLLPTLPGYSTFVCSRTERITADSHNIVKKNFEVGKLMNSFLVAGSWNPIRWNLIQKGELCTPDRSTGKVQFKCVPE